MKLISTFSKRLKELRTEKDLTLEEFSKLLNIPAQTLNRYELEQRVPKIDTATQIACTLNINPLWLNGFDEPKEINNSVKNNFQQNSQFGYGGDLANEEEKDNEFTKIKHELLSTLHSANLDVRQMKELITIIKAFERL